MTATATRLIQESFPISPLGGTLGGGMQSVSWRPTKEVWNKTTGETINAPVQAQVDPIKGRAGWKDDSRSGAVGIPLACIDDPNNSSSDWWWIRTPHVQGVPGEELAFYVTLATADIVLVANLVPASSNPIQTGLIDITSADHSATITTPSPGVRDISVVGGGGGGSAHIIEDEGTPLTARAKLNFIGAGVTATDNPGANSTDVTIPVIGVTSVTGTPPIASSGGATPAISIAAATTSAVGAVQLATPSSDVTAGHVVQASDARLSDSRAPSGTAGGDLGGTYPNPAVAGVAAGRVDITEIAAPANPAAGKLRLYAKTDDTLHVLSSAGVDTALGAGGGGASFPLQSPFPGGNARGAGATDLQTVHSANSMVASGTDATIGGGQDNTASGNWAVVAGGRTNVAGGRDGAILGGIGNTTSGNEPTIVGGNGNVASNDNTFVGGGQANTASGFNSVVAGGVANTASGLNSSIPGGNSNVASGDYSRAAGLRAVASHYGQDAFAAFRFTVDGDAQRGDVPIGNATVDATATELFLDGPAATQRLTLAAGRMLSYSFQINARQDTGAAVACWKGEGILNRVTAGNVVLSGNTVTAIGTPPGGWGLVVSADTTHQSLLFTATGAAATNIHWFGTIRIVETI